MIRPNERTAKAGLAEPPTNDALVPATPPAPPEAKPLAPELPPGQNVEAAKQEAARRAELARIAAIGAPFELHKDKITGKTDPEPQERTVKWWGLRMKWPAWLVAAMGAQRYPNQELTEREAEDLALATAGLPLGVQKGKA